MVPSNCGRRIVSSPEEEIHVVLDDDNGLSIPFYSPNGTYHFPRAIDGTACRRIRHRSFSQPGGLWAYSATACPRKTNDADHVG